MSKKSQRIKRVKMIKKSRSKFRFYHKAGHPALMILENGRFGEGMLVSHKPASGKNRSYQLLENPEYAFVSENGQIQRKTESAHLNLQLRRGVIGIDFGKDYLALFRLSVADEETIAKIVKAKKEGKPFSEYLSPEEKRRIYPRKKK